MVGDDHHALRLRQPVDAQLVELAFRRQHHTVMDHHEIGLRFHHVAGAQLAAATARGQDFLYRGHRHAGFLLRLLRQRTLSDADYRPPRVGRVRGRPTPA